MPWKPGESGNPKGGIRKPEIELVRQAIDATEKEKKKSLWKHLIEQCYIDNAVLIAVAKKFMPDQVSIGIDKSRNQIIVKFEDRSFKQIVDATVEEPKNQIMKIV